MQKRIFNSVGSNYNLGFAMRAFFAVGGNSDQKLISYLDNRFGGKTTLFYKGREAILYALKSSGIELGSKIVICAYTCAVVPTAIKNAGLVPVYADISPDSLDFDFETFKNIAEKDSSVRAVIVQNTLGFTNDINEIEEYCKARGIILIEDLAHSLGAKYPDGREVGTVGDYVILSFSQDKILDAISGGALITRTNKAKQIELEWKAVSIRDQIRDRLYPALTWKIRLYYPIGLGKFMHFVLKKTNGLSVPVVALDNKVEKLPAWYASLALHRFKTLDNDIKRRQDFALEYLNTIPNFLHKTMNKESILRATCLRIPLLIENRNEVIKKIEKKGIYISDIWYDVPVSPMKYWHMFLNENKEERVRGVASKMLNLPTHMTLNNKDVKRIVGELKNANNI